MCLRLDVLLNVQNLSVLTDEERPAKRQTSIFGDDAVSFGNLLLRIAEDGIVELKGFGELLVQLRRVATGGEESDVELPQGFPVRTERDTFGRSATGERFGVPGDNNRLFCL